MNRLQQPHDWRALAVEQGMIEAEQLTATEVVRKRLAQRPIWIGMDLGTEPSVSTRYERDANHPRSIKQPLRKDGPAVVDRAKGGQQTGSSGCNPGMTGDTTPSPFDGIQRAVQRLQSRDNWRLGWTP